MADETATAPTTAPAAPDESTKKRGRPKGEAKPKAEKSADDLRSEHAKLKEKESRLLADLAIKEHPELENSIESLTQFVRELQKSDEALKSGADQNVAKKKEELQRRREWYVNKIAAIDDSLSKTDSTSIVDQLKNTRTEHLGKLKEAYEAVLPSFTEAGASVGALLPTIKPYLEELGVEA